MWWVATHEEGLLSGGIATMETLSLVYTFSELIKMNFLIKREMTCCAVLNYFFACAVFVCALKIEFFLDFFMFVFIVYCFYLVVICLGPDFCRRRIERKYP